MRLEILKFKMGILTILAIGAIASQPSQAHDNWSVGISIGNPYPPAVAYYPPALPPAHFYPAPRNIYYGPQVFVPPTHLGPTTYIYRAPSVVYGPVVGQPYVGRSFGRHDSYRSYRGQHRHHGRDW